MSSHKLFAHKALLNQFRFLIPRPTISFDYLRFPIFSMICFILSKREGMDSTLEAISYLRRVICASVSYSCSSSSSPDVIVNNCVNMCPFSNPYYSNTKIIKFYNSCNISKYGWKRFKFHPTPTQNKPHWSNWKKILVEQERLRQMVHRPT